MKLKPLILALLYSFLQLITIEARADEERFVLKNESGKLTFEIQISENHIIYGPNKDKAAMPTEINLKLSTNLQNHQLAWPEPQEKQLPTGKIIHFYENHLEIPLLLEPIDSKKSSELEFDISYVICGEQCELIKDHIAIELDKDFWSEAERHYKDNHHGGETKGDVAISGDKTFTTQSLLGLPRPLHGLAMTNLSTLLLALMGGFILNFMPCVLPVLSLKIISFIRHPEIDRKKASIFTIFGIMSSFWAIALIGISFKNAGKHFGLGTNFQEPTFIIALILIITFFISIALDRISWNVPNLAILFTHRSSRGMTVGFESYFSGIIATILSTPCNAPFFGSALFLSLGQSNSFIFITFSMIGLGFSLPYFALVAWPASLNFLPRSGKWMSYLKLILSLMLICTLFWLLTIIQAQINTRTALGLFGLMLLMMFVLERNEFILNYFYVKMLCLLIIICSSFLLPWYSYNETQQQQIESNNLWQKFEPEKIDSLVSEGKIVFVDITADWCVTCKYNKYFVLEREKVMEILSDKQIVAMRGDFTNYSSQIHDFLVKRQKHAIPYNVIFGPSIPAGIDLPVIVSREAIEDGIERAR